MNGPNLPPGNPAILADPRKQAKIKEQADAQTSAMVRGSIIRLYEHLCVSYALARTLDEEGQPIENPELRPDELEKLAAQATYMAPFVFYHLGMISSPVPQDGPPDAKAE